jgi:hypothetical protein
MSGIISDNLGRATGLIKAAGGGKVLQVVTATSNTKTDVTSTSWATHSKDIAITPSATTSKVLVMYTFSATQSGSSDHAFTIFRDSTNLGHATYGLLAQTSYGGMGGGRHIATLDSPSTTSEVTYGLYSVPTTTIIAMEIDGS